MRTFTGSFGSVVMAIFSVVIIPPSVAQRCSCWSSNDCLYQPWCGGDICDFDWYTYSYQCQHSHTTAPAPSPTPPPIPSTPVCGVCWSHFECQSKPNCGERCGFDFDTHSYQCLDSLPATPRPTPRPTSHPTPRPTPKPTPPIQFPFPTPTGAGDKVFGIIPDRCQVLTLTGRMEQAVQLNATLLPQWLRLAFHDAGTFNQQTSEGGANGCLLSHAPMREQRENRNLDLAIGPLTFIKDFTEVRVSNADLIQFAGFFTVIRQSNGPGLGRSKRERLLRDFRWGRPDTVVCDVAWTQNLPSFSLGTDEQNIAQRCLFAGGEIKKKMMDRNGFTAEEATVLIGAHTIGLTRNEFGPTLAAPWVTNGADHASPEGPVFDNEYHRFLAQDVVASTAEEFATSQLPFDEVFPTWFRSNDRDPPLNHLDTDVVLAFPSQDLNIHPHFDFLTQMFASDNDLFLFLFLEAFDKMTRLGVSVNTLLVEARSCDGHAHGGFFSPGPFESLLQETIGVAEEELEETLIERDEEIETLTTPITIPP